MMNLTKVTKVIGKLAMPVLAGIMTVTSELDSQKQRQAVATLTRKVAELESKIK